MLKLLKEGAFKKKIFFKTVYLDKCCFPCT